VNLERLIPDDVRRKLAEKDGEAPIQTVRSAGYRLVSADA
jgi:DNA-binding response OmpR family regulator